jgi:membrane protease YdiL (CAAX protease family)
MRDRLAFILPTALIVMAEAAFFQGLLIASLSLHLLNIFICVVLVIVTKRSEDLYAAFIMISLLRVLNIGMPRFFDISLYLFIFIYLPIILAAFLFWYVLKVPEGRKIDGRMIWRFANGVGPDEAPTFRWTYVPLALVIGLGLAFLEYWVLRPEALVVDLTFGSLLLLMVVMVAFVGFGEELVFRGALQESVRTRSSIVIAILFSSFMFAMMHSGYSSLPYLVYVFFVGLVLGVGYWKTRNLIFVSLIHGFINFFLFSFLPNGWWPW